MIEFILSTLAEFGLIREDYKHQKRISKKEKEDGIKRPIQKYFLHYVYNSKKNCFPKKI